MSVLTNSATTETLTLRAMRSTSFSFLVKLVDSRKRPVDITGSVFRLVVDKGAFLQPSQLIKAPTIVNANEGVLRFDLQAEDLNFPEAHYPYVITMLTPLNYSSVLVKGQLEIEQNPDQFAVNLYYDEGNPLSGVEVVFRGTQVALVTASPMMPPNMNYFSDAEKVTLNDLVDRVRALEAP